MSNSHHSLLFEMLRSFTVLARTLNLSRTVEELGSTRQTVRRHIAILEEFRGVALFALEDRQYRLTDAGHHALPEALDILARGTAWLSGQSGHMNGLFHLKLELDDGWGFFTQQHPLSEVWLGNSVLLKASLQAWCEAQGSLDHPAFDPVRPYMMVFRFYQGQWICVDVGDKSSYATWYGRQWERSSVGRGLPELPGGPELARLLSQAYEDIRATCGVRLDHVQTQMSRGESGELEPISYARLLMGGRFADNDFAMVSMIERTHDIIIKGLSDQRRTAMPADLVTIPDL